MSRCRWKIRPPIPDTHALSRPDIHPLVAQLAYNRGINDPVELEAFLTGDKRLSYDPFQLPGMDAAVPRIYRALLGGEGIAVYGDYDVDGVTATATMVEGIAALGGHAIPYIPHRLTEGYGMSLAGLEKLHKLGISLIITVDCGITSVNEVKAAKRMGMDVIVTDHHTPLDELPRALAVVNPKLAVSEYPYRDLAGVGVAMKVVQALMASMGRDADPELFSDLAALGTIADISPLNGENRFLVKAGLRLINEKPRPGITQIAAVNTITRLDVEAVSWIIAPCINAAGRMDHAMGAYTLLTTKSIMEAAQLALWLREKNQERQRLTVETMERARQQVSDRGITPVLMAGDKDTHSGISGLVAGRLVEEFYRPAIVMRIADDVCTGSCRSIPEFNIIQSLDQCRSLLTRYGGHSQAAGFALPTANLPKLQMKLTEIAAKLLQGKDLRAQLDIDGEVVLDGLGGATYQAVQQMSPFGEGNPAPNFMSLGVQVLDFNRMGKNGEHMRMKLRQGTMVWNAVAFRMGDRAGEVTGPLDIVFNLEIDRWNGAESLRLTLLDFQRHP